MCHHMLPYPKQEKRGHLHRTITDETKGPSKVWRQTLGL